LGNPGLLVTSPHAVFDQRARDLISATITSGFELSRSHWVNQPPLCTVILCRPRNEREVFLFNFMRIQKPATALLLDRERTVTRG
jgi:hypothetical protein